MIIVFSKMIDHNTKHTDKSICNSKWKYFILGEQINTRHD